MARMVRHLKRKIFDRNQRGSAIVQMALVLPLLLMLTLGVIEYSWLFLNAQALTNAARHGARLAAPDGALTTDAYNSMMALLNTRQSDNMISGDTYVTTYHTSGSPSREVVEASITINTANILLINAPGLIPVPSTLRGRVIMAKE